MSAGIVKRLIGKVWDAIGREASYGDLSAPYTWARAGECFRRSGIRTNTIDSSMAGVDGCPAAPGASGNIVTENLDFLPEATG